MGKHRDTSPYYWVRDQQFSDVDYRGRHRNGAPVPAVRPEWFKGWL